MDGHSAQQRPLHRSIDEQSFSQMTHNALDGKATARIGLRTIGQCESVNLRKLRLRRSLARGAAVENRSLAVKRSGRLCRFYGWNCDELAN